MSSNSKLDIFPLKNTPRKSMLLRNCRKFPTEITHSKCAHKVETPSRMCAQCGNYKTESNNMFRNLSVMTLLPQNVTFQFANANIQVNNSNLIFQA